MRAKPTPLDFGVDDLIVNEWERFTEALTDLSDGGLARARQLAQRIQPGDPQPRIIHIPGIDSVFQLYPRAQITKEQLAVHFRAVNAGQPSPLHPTLVAEIERRAAVAARIRSSNVPHWAQAYGTMMTAIDNVQDLLSTISTVGRLTLGPIARALERGLPDITRAEALSRADDAFARQLAARKAAGEAFTELGERRLRERIRAATLAAARQRLLDPRRAASRLAIPLLGVVMTAADLLNLLTMIAMLAFPGYAAWCAGFGAALAAGVPASIFGRGLKSIASKSQALNPFSKQARIDRSRVLRTIRPSIQNLIEVAQTSKELFGVGMTFGWMVGGVQEAVFGVEQWLRGREQSLFTPKYAREYHGLFRLRLQRLNLAQLDDLRAAALALTWGPFWLDPQAPLTIFERIEGLAAHNAALSILRPWIASEEMDRALDLAESEAITPPRWAFFDSRPLLELQGLAPTGPYVWPLPGAPERVEWKAVAPQLAKLAADGLEEIVFPIRWEIEGQVLAAFAAKIQERTSILIAGADDAINQELTPGLQVVESLCLANRLLHAGDPPEVRLRFLQLAQDKLDRSRRRSLTDYQLDALAREAGARLIPLLPTTAHPGSPTVPAAAP